MLIGISTFFIVAALLFTMFNETALSFMIYMLSGLALVMYASPFHWAFWFTPILYGLGWVVFFLEVRHHARHRGRIRQTKTS